MKPTATATHPLPTNRADGYALRTRESTTPTWKRYLPAGWRVAIDEPLHFEHYSEYEICAERSIGYDADDLPCFTAHHFQLTSLATDDDEEFYEVVTYSEEMAAWRLCDERWLIFRTISTNSCRQSRGFYAFSTEMPR